MSSLLEIGLCSAVRTVGVARGQLAGAWGCHALRPAERKFCQVPEPVRDAKNA